MNREKSRYSFNIFRKAIKCKYHIILSDQVLYELSKIIEYSSTKFLFEFLKNKLILIKLEANDKLEAKLIPTHYSDALHILLARKAKADLIVTNNIRDFASIFKSERPENL